MALVSCETCGAEASAGARFCSICGQDLPAAPISRKSTDGARNSPSSTKEWTLGSSQPCDILVSGATVSSRHCRLTRSGNGTYTIEDLGSANGTYIAGQRITGPTPVQASQPVTLGRAVPFPWDRVLNPESTSSAPVSVPPGALVITIGRSPENDVVIDYPAVSSYHARVLLSPAGAVIEDLGSTNGTALNTIGRKIRRAPLNPEDRVYFGSYPVSAAKLLTRNDTAAIGTQPQQTIAVGKDVMVVGRDPDCDFPLPFPSVSWHHAEIHRTGRGIEVRDLKSLNGTFINGERITGTHVLEPGQIVSLGSISLELTVEGDLQRRDYKGNVTIEVDDLCVNARGGSSDRLLDRVNVTVFPTELVALMGPSGAGKTTLLKALNGYTIPAAGSVLFNGNSLYASFDSFRLELGYVPQDDIIHPLLTVSEALYFTARLRTDLRDSEIRERIETVLRTLDISSIAGKLIGSPERKVISGGQRKRVNIAMELICDPTVLFLDEPTSGLSSSDSLKVVQHLYELARGGKTVILTIHQPSTAIYKLFDQLIMVSRDSREKMPPGVAPGPAKLIYFGPAYPDSLEFFNPAAVEELKQRAPGADPAPEVVFEGLEASSLNTTEWEQKYLKSPQKRQYSDERKGTVHTTEHASARKGQRFQFGQLWSLVHRNLLLKVRDHLQTGILLAQAPAFALLVYLAFGKLAFDKPADGEWLGFTAKLSSVHFLMVIAAIWFGCNNAVREVVGEWAIFEREQIAGLKIPLYIVSKFVVLGGLCTFQCFSLLAIVYTLCNLHGSFGPTFLILLANSLCGVGIGLCVSSRFRTTDSALASLPLVLLPMIVLAGGIQPVHTMNGASQVIAMAIPSRWGYEANLLDEARFEPSYAFNPCRRVIEQAEEQTRNAVLKTQAGCEDQMRLQDRRMRDKLGPLAGTIMPPVPKKIAMPAPAASPGRAAEVPVDIAEGAFPVRPNRPEYLKSIPQRSPYWMCLGILCAMQTAMILLCYLMLRRRVIHS